MSERGASAVLKLASAASRLATVWGLALGGLGLLALLLVARFVDRPRPWPLELLDTFALYAFAAFLALGLAGAWLRSKLLVLVALGGGLLFVQQFGASLLPRPALAAPAGPSLRVLTYNVWWRNRDPAPLVELVRSVKPDVVVLQEITPEFADDLARSLGRDYPYRAVEAREDGNDSGGVLSRLPILEARSFKLTDDGNDLQQLRFRLGEADVWLLNVHLDSPRLRTSNPPGPIPRIVSGFGTARREVELQRLAGLAGQIGGPLILAGDFNLAAGSRPYRGFPDEWLDAFAKRGRGFGHTFPTTVARWLGGLAMPFPLVRIDYVLSTGGLEPTAAWVPEVGGSDHRPVVAELRLRSR